MDCLNIVNDKVYATLWRQGAPHITGVAKKTRSFFRSSMLFVCSTINLYQEDKFLRCLYCHYVFDDQTKDLERLILKLKKSGCFIDTDTCVEMLEGKKIIDNRYYHLSFDDGFRNNIKNALPVLVKHSVPAIFFVPSSLIGASWDKAYEYCTRTMKYNSAIEMLSWGDLKEIVSLGYEIGSHTRTHARFSEISLDANKLNEEIFGSKNDLESNLGCECKYISWPFGRLTDADNESLKMVMKAGYRACFGAFRGTVIPGKTDIFSIPRHHFEVEWPVSHIEFFARGNMEVVSNR